MNIGSPNIEKVNIETSIDAFDPKPPVKITYSDSFVQVDDNSKDFKNQGTQTVTPRKM